MQLQEQRDESVESHRAARTPLPLGSQQGTKSAGSLFPSSTNETQHVVHKVEVLITTEDYTSVVYFALMIPISLGPFAGCCLRGPEVFLRSQVNSRTIDKTIEIGVSRSFPSCGSLMLWFHNHHDTGLAAPVVPRFQKTSRWLCLRCFWSFCYFIHVIDTRLLFGMPPASYIRLSKSQVCANPVF